MNDVDWDEVDFLTENGYWPEYRGDYYSREYNDDGKTNYTFKELDFLLDYAWAQDYFYHNHNLTFGKPTIKKEEEDESIET